VILQYLALMGEGKILEGEGRTLPPPVFCRSSTDRGGRKKKDMSETEGRKGRDPKNSNGVENIPLERSERRKGSIVKSFTVLERGPRKGEGRIQGKLVRTSRFRRNSFGSKERGKWGRQLTCAVKKTNDE